MTPSVNASRLPWWMNRPPVNWLRIAKGPAVVVLRIAMPGWSFHVPENSCGRLIPVCQSTVVENVRPYNT